MVVLHNGVNTLIMQQPNNNGLLEKDETIKTIQSFNWSSTPLGDYSNWPESLRQAVCEKLNATQNVNL